MTPALPDTFPEVSPEAFRSLFGDILGRAQGHWLFIGCAVCAFYGGVFLMSYAGALPWRRERFVYDRERKVRFEAEIERRRKLPNPALRRELITLAVIYAVVLALAFAVQVIAWTT